VTVVPVVHYSSWYCALSNQVPVHLSLVCTVQHYIMDIFGKSISSTNTRKYYFATCARTSITNLSTKNQPIISFYCTSTRSKYKFQSKHIILYRQVIYSTTVIPFSANQRTSIHSRMIGFSLFQFYHLFFL
jgi:hypothetical protein